MQALYVSGETHLVVSVHSHDLDVFLQRYDCPSHGNHDSMGTRDDSCLGAKSSCQRDLQPLKASMWHRSA